jgi:polysaccharide chain length determinant protein (PEP-CTERM system associated)
MKKAKLQTVNDYLALIVRRRWWVIIPTVALGGLTILIVLLFPKIYVSKTMLLLQPREMPQDFVMDLVGGETNERLTTIEQTVLSRTNLLKLISEFENRLPEYRTLNDERKVARLKKRIAIAFSAAQQRSKDSSTNIQISYRDESPDLAQKIAARIASFFIEEDNRTRENRVFGTAEFLESELSKVAEQLKQSEDKLKVVEQRYRYELPSELDTNLRTLDRLQLQKNGNLEALDRSMTQQMILERQMSETPPTISRESAANPNLAAPATNPLVEIYRKKEQEYSELIARAKPTHPDARRLKAELEQMKKVIPPEDLEKVEKENSPDQSVPDTVPNPVYQSLTAQLGQLKTDIEIRQKEKKWIEEEMAKYNQRILNMPGVKQEMMSIIRTTADLQKTHEDLRTKVAQAKLAGSLESRQRGSQFEIIDAANLPMEPSSLNPIIILGAGFIASLAVGIIIALLVNILGGQVWTNRDLEKALEVPVLVEIPAIVTPADIKKVMRRRLIHAFLLVALSGVYLSGIFYLYHKQSIVLRLLDPVIEKIAERAAG